MKDRWFDVVATVALVLFVSTLVLGLLARDLVRQQARDTQTIMELRDSLDVLSAKLAQGASLLGADGDSIARFVRVDRFGRVIVSPSDECERLRARLANAQSALRMRAPVPTHVDSFAYLREQERMR